MRKRGTMTTTNYDRSYSELIKLQTFKERYEYLKLDGIVARPTFGSARYLNQQFYTSELWIDFKEKIIIRDSNEFGYCCDLGLEGHEIPEGLYIIVHHINPVTVEDIVNKSEKLLDPENVISTTLRTHNAIHYGSYDQLFDGLVERRPNDTCPWKL